MREQRLAERYAKALFDLGQEEKSLERFQEEIRRFRAVLQAEPHLLRVLTSREIEKTKRHKILGELMSKFLLGPMVQNFLKLLQERNRLTLFSEITKAFDGYVRKMENVAVAKVTVADFNTARVYSEKLREALEEVTGQKIEIEMAENKDLIGGIQVNLGDKVFDASIQGELERIKETWI